MKALMQDAGAGLSKVFDARTAEGIELIENEIRQALGDSDGTIPEMCRYIFDAGGKRIRPLMVLYSGMVFESRVHKLLDAAAAAELIHIASLAHDDIIDESSLRRGKPSINVVWGNDFAVLCGDYLFARAFGLLSGSRLLQSLDYMVEAIQNMCMGEILQADERFDISAGMDKYYDRIAKKTAVFLQCCCKSGAAAAGAGRIAQKLLGEFGLNVGYAFQIIDDILDYCGDTVVMGKPKGEDLKQGNITLPLILLSQNSEYRCLIEELVSKRNFSAQMVDSLSNMMKESGIIDKAFKIAGSHLTRARQSLERLPQNKYTCLLYEITDMLESRMN